MEQETFDEIQGLKKENLKLRQMLANVKLNLETGIQFINLTVEEPEEKYNAPRR